MTREEQTDEKLSLIGAVKEMLCANARCMCNTYEEIVYVTKKLRLLVLATV
jgi:hypothetical protein